MTINDIVSALLKLRSDTTGFGCVLSGGEPLLQADSALLQALGDLFSWVDIETNGSKECPERPANVFVSCSPKSIPGIDILVDPDWWKILIPDQEHFLERALASGKKVYVQPTCPDDGPEGNNYQQALKRCLELCYQTGCSLSLQTHKYIDVP